MLPLLSIRMFSAYVRSGYLQVSVDDAFLMEVVDGQRHLSDADSHHFLRKVSVLLEHVVERAALAVLQPKAEIAARLKRVQELVYELVAQLGEQLLLVECIFFFGVFLQILLTDELESRELPGIVSSDQEYLREAADADVLDDGDVLQGQTSRNRVPLERYELDAFGQLIESLSIVCQHVVYIEVSIFRGEQDVMELYSR